VGGAGGPSDSRGGDGGSAFGGSLYNGPGATLILQAVKVLYDSAEGGYCQGAVGGKGGDGLGGGVFTAHSSTLTIDAESFISRNEAVKGKGSPRKGANGKSVGGGVFVEDTAPRAMATIANKDETVKGNTAQIDPNIHGLP
jgi:hypothetical protein